MTISILFVGDLHDHGFNQCALAGAEFLRDTGAQIEIVSGVPYDPEAMTAALHAAVARSRGVVFIGGQGNLVTPPIAAANPDCAFAVVQGNVLGTNLASYDVLQEQSAFLGGVLAARLTQTGTVGHLSGHRVAPGLKGRAAFASGVRFADPNVRFVTGFCGTQDDSGITEAWTTAIAGQGADVIFTMLNSARDGATRACAATGIRQIGNVTDWCATNPKVFVASALARIDLGVMRAVDDILSGTVPGEIQHMGIGDGAVELSLAPDVSEPLRAEIASLARQIADGQITIQTTYDGPEFEFRA